ncbi:MAG: hypothetical protein JW827_04415 [Spirochaetes bacterium]|nr:hypothetical protein [Spirochaetota bacterium]
MKIMKKIILMLFFLSTLIYAQDEPIYPITKFFIQKSQICSPVEELWPTMEGEIIYELKSVKYFQVFHYKVDSSLGLPEMIKVRFRVEKCSSDSQFIIQSFILSKLKGKTFTLKNKFLINNDKDIKKFPRLFKNYVTKMFPLTGIVLNVSRNKIKINLGKKQDLVKGDVFLIKDQHDHIIASAIVMEADQYDSDLYLTKSIKSVKPKDLAVPYTFSQANLLHSIRSKKVKTNVRKYFPYRIKGLESQDFKIFISSTTNYALISDAEETMFLNIDKLYMEKVNSLDYNSLSIGKFSYHNSFCGYITFLNSFSSKIFNLNNFKIGHILKNPLENSYSLKGHTEDPFQYVPIKAFDFSISEKMFFFNEEDKNLIELDIPLNLFKRIDLSNKISDLLELTITPNEEMIIMFFRSEGRQNLLVLDLEDKTEYIIDNVNWYFLDKSGINLIYAQEKNLNQYNLYTKKYETLIKLDYPAQRSMISFSERYMAILNSGKENQLDLYDQMDASYRKDVFDSGKLKFIKAFDWLPGYNFLLLYGRLKDADRNDKIDYKDPDLIMLFDPVSRKSYPLLYDIDDYYGSTPDGNFIFCRKRKRLTIHRIPYEKIIAP